MAAKSPVPKNDNTILPTSPTLSSGFSEPTNALETTANNIKSGSAMLKNFQPSFCIKRGNNIDTPKANVARSAKDFILKYLFAKKAAFLQTYTKRKAKNEHVEFAAF